MTSLLYFECKSNRRGQVCDSYYYPFHVSQDCFLNESSAKLDKYQAIKIKPALYKTHKISKNTVGHQWQAEAEAGCGTKDSSGGRHQARAHKMPDALGIPD